MGLGTYLKNSVFDFLLCAVASSALCYACLIAFNATHPFQDSPLLVIGCCTALTAALFVIAYDFRTAVFGSVLLALAVIGAALASWASSGAAGLFDDVAGNGAFLVLMIAACAVLTFVLSRRKALVLVLLVGGTLACAVMEYLYWDHQVVATLLFVLAAGSLYAYRNYQQGLLGSDSEQLAFGTTTLAAVGVCLLALVLSVGVFAAAIEPLQPQSVTVKLLTRHVRLQEEKVTGVGDDVSVQNERLFSNNTSGQTEGSSSGEGTSNDRQSDSDEQQRKDQTQHAAGASYGLDSSSDDEAQAQRLQPPEWLPLVLPLAILLAVVLVIVARKAVRRSRYRKISALAPRARVRASYLMLVGAFDKMRVSKGPGLTLEEHARGAHEVFSRFERTSAEPAFPGLTRIYEGVVYGERTPSEEELGRFESYYRRFYKNARRFVGRLKYCILFFRI